jgi:hypothetical protein
MMKRAMRLPNPCRFGGNTIGRPVFLHDIVSRMPLFGKTPSLARAPKCRDHARKYGWSQVTHIGRVDFRNDNRLFGIKNEDRFSHVYVIGKTGTGKSERDPERLCAVKNARWCASRS